MTDRVKLVSKMPLEIVLASELWLGRPKCLFFHHTIDRAALKSITRLLRSRI